MRRRRSCSRSRTPPLPPIRADSRTWQISRLRPGAALSRPEEACSLAHRADGYSVSFISVHAIAHHAALHVVTHHAVLPTAAHLVHRLHVVLHGRHVCLHGRSSLLWRPGVHHRVNLTLHRLHLLLHRLHLRLRRFEAGICRCAGLSEAKTGKGYQHWDEKACVYGFHVCHLELQNQSKTRSAFGSSNALLAR